MQQPDSARPHHDRLAPLALFLVLALAAPALAHDAHADGSFASGITHPFGGLDHVLAMIAVGIWGAQLGRPEIWLLPITFPLVMAIGGAAGLMGFPIPGAEIGIAISAVALGVMVLLEARPPIGVSMAMVGVFAVFHGYAHGAELPAGQSGLLYSLGFVISTGVLHAIGIGIGTIHRWSQGRVALRVAGGGVMAGGLFFLITSLGWMS